MALPPFALRLVGLVALLCYASAAARAQTPSADYANGHCTDAVMRISVVANNTVFKLDPPENEEILTDFIVRLTSEGSTVAEDVIGGTVVNNATYGIYTMLCVPSKQDERKTVELALHG